MSRRGAVIVGALIGILGTSVGAQVATPLMIGRWRGEAEVVVSWPRQRTFLVDITIVSGDSVTGTIGDAKIVNGRFLSNRGPVGRFLRWKTDYIIEANLDGLVIRADSISRASVSLPLNWREGHFEGGVSTSGSKVGSAEHMALAAKLTLHRVPDMLICTSGIDLR